MMITILVEFLILWFGKIHENTIINSRNVVYYDIQGNLNRNIQDKVFLVDNRFVMLDGRNNHWSINVNKSFTC